MRVRRAARLGGRNPSKKSRRRQFPRHNAASTAEGPGNAGDGDSGRQRLRRPACSRDRRRAAWPGVRDQRQAAPRRAAPIDRRAHRPPHLARDRHERGRHAKWARDCAKRVCPRQSGIGGGQGAIARSKVMFAQIADRRRPPHCKPGANGFGFCAHAQRREALGRDTCILSASARSRRVTPPPEPKGIADSKPPPLEEPFTIRGLNANIDREDRNGEEWLARARMRRDNGAPAHWESCPERG